jgi:Fic family protein
LNTEEKFKLFQLGNTGKPEYPAGTYARQILNRLLIDLSWNSSRLEGNTYSLLDTERLISGGESADNKSPMETQMILNHKEAIEFIVQPSEAIGFNRYTILNLHAHLSNNLLPDPAAPGRLRTFSIGIGNSVYTPLAIPQQIEEMFDLLLAKASEIKDPFEQAFFVMVHLPYLQPFDDVNKRVSRLAANIPLNLVNQSPITFAEVPKDLYIKGLLAIYESNDITLLKDVFIWAYERSAAKYAAVRQSLGEPDPFRLKYREELKVIISEIISSAMTRQELTDFLEEKSKEISIADQTRFAKEVQTELKALHEGNFARYRVTPKEFQRWKSKWNQNSSFL